MKILKRVIKIVVILALSIGIVICTSELYGDREDISGTIIAKDKVSVGKGSQRYVFAIHPDNDKRFEDFDIYVPLYNYTKFEVGDRVVFRDMSTYQRIKNPKWYESVEINLAIIFLLVITLGVWILYHIDKG